MMVPQPRLLFWFAAIALPCAVLGAARPEAAPLGALAVVALALLAGLDGLLGRGRLDGVTVHLPEVTRLLKSRTGTVEVRVRNGGGRPMRLRLGLPWPREMAAAEEERSVLLPAAEWARLDWPVRALRRGESVLAGACLETGSPIGFWALRRAVPLRSRLRVYPSLLHERKNLAALFLNRGAFGVHAQRQIGRGREFEKLRDYLPGDGFDEIHWKATAKRGRPVTKVFQVERTQEVYVIVDASRLSARQPAGGARGLDDFAGTTRADSPEGAPPDGPASASSGAEAASILERYVTAALVLGLAAERQGDLFGLMSFSDGIEAFVRARNGRAHYGACRDAIYALQPRQVTPDFDEMASFIRLRLRRRALLIILTSLDDPALADAFARSMELLSRQHLVLANMLKPPGAEPLFGGAEVDGLEGLYNRLGGHLRWHSLRELEMRLQRRGVRFTLLENETLCPQLVSRYLAVKQRQAL